MDADRCGERVPGWDTSEVDLRYRWHRVGTGGRRPATCSPRRGKGWWAAARTACTGAWHASSLALAHADAVGASSACSTRHRLKSYPSSSLFMTALNLYVLSHSARRATAHTLCLGGPRASAAHHFGVAEAVADEHALSVHQHDHRHADLEHRACQLQEGLCAPRLQSARAATLCQPRARTYRPGRVPGLPLPGGLHAARSNTTRHQAPADTACKVEPAAAQYC
jgi:hypothetical protein